MPSEYNFGIQINGTILSIERLTQKPNCLCIFYIVRAEKEIEVNVQSAASVCDRKAVPNRCWISYKTLPLNR